MANQHGIRFIHQELNLCNDLKVFENMFLGEELRKKTGLLDKKEMTSRCAQVFQRMKVNIDPNALVADLPAAEKQLVEIAKALLFRSELIIMDETLHGPVHPGDRKPVRDHAPAEEGWRELHLYFP